MQLCIGKLELGVAVSDMTTPRKTEGSPSFEAARSFWNGSDSNTGTTQVEETFDQPCVVVVVVGGVAVVTVVFLDVLFASSFSWSSGAEEANVLWNGERESSSFVTARW